MTPDFEVLLGGSWRVCRARIINGMERKKQCSSEGVKGVFPVGMKQSMFSFFGRSS